MRFQRFRSRFQRLRLPFFLALLLTLFFIPLLGVSASAARQTSQTTLQLTQHKNAPTLLTTTTPFVAMGFAIGWSMPTNPPWGDITQENLFALQTTKGTALDTSFLSGVNVPAFVAAAHAHGVQTLITIGGSDDQNWQYACTGSNRAGFVQNLVSYMQTNGFDGIDLDIEDDVWAAVGPPDADMTSCIEAIATAARAVKTQAGATPRISADVITNWEGPWFAPSQAYVDQFNLMTYGDACSATSCATLHDDIAATISQGLPASKLVPGIDIIDYPTDTSSCGPVANYAQQSGLMGAFVWDESTDETGGYTCARQFVPFIGGTAPAPTPTATATPLPTPTSTATPTPTPAPTATSVPCVELVNGVMTVGTCTGTFTPGA